MPSNSLLQMCARFLRCSLRGGGWGRGQCAAGRWLHLLSYCYWHKSAWDCFKAVSSSKPTWAAPFGHARQGSMSGGCHQGQGEENKKAPSLNYHFLVLFVFGSFSRLPIYNASITAAFQPLYGNGKVQRNLQILLSWCFLAKHSFRTNPDFSEAAAFLASRHS